MRNKFHKNIKKFILNDTKSATTRRGGGIFLINPSVKPIGLPAPFTREPYRKRFGKIRTFFFSIMLTGTLPLP